MLVCLVVSIKRKTAEPIGPKYFAANNMTPEKEGLWMVKSEKMSIIYFFRNLLMFTEKSAEFKVAA